MFYFITWKVYYLYMFLIQCLLERKLNYWKLLVYTNY